MSKDHLLSICLIVLTSLMLVGCAGDADPAPGGEPAARISSPENQQNSAAEPAEAEKSDIESRETASHSIPDGFPADIFVADGSTVLEKNDNGGKKSLVLEYAASDIEEFIKNYQDGMSQRGWTQVASSKHPIGTITNFSKDDRKCTISISPPKAELIKVSILLSSP